MESVRGIICAVMTIAISFAAGCGGARQSAPAYYRGAPSAMWGGSAPYFAERPVETYNPASPRQVGSAFIYLAGSVVRQLVNFEIVNGMAVMEGDIMLGPATLVPFRYALPQFMRGNIFGAVTLLDRSDLWPRGEIPYVIDASVSADKAQTIALEIQHVNQTELELRPRSEADHAYVVFRDSGPGSGCSSYLGRQGGAQSIEVAECGRGSVIHEILHAAGFYHEQSRGDRDQYVAIHWDVIAPGRQSAFEMRDHRGQDIGPYDYGSIMHYSSRAFSKNGSPTITPKVENAIIGQREGLSVLDRAAITELYGTKTVPPPPGPPLPGPQPPGPQPPGPQTPSPNGPFEGSYSSSHGSVVCAQSGSAVNCRYSSGVLICVAMGDRLECGWSGEGSGRAVFQRRADGVLEGMWGNFFSSNDRGQWDLIPLASNPAPSPPLPLH